VNTKGRKVEMANCDAILHGAALAHRPPAGIVYSPDGDGRHLPSLGVHEHWNNPQDKSYSGRKEVGGGIELISLHAGQAQDAPKSAR
jgi:hypothetical protein